MRDVACPTLILHSPEDDIVPYAMARQLFAASRAPRAFADLAGGHNGGGIAVIRHAQQALEDLVDTVLGRRP